MPPKTPDLDERLRAVRDGRLPREPEEGQPSGDRDSKVQVHLYTQPHSRRTTAPPPHDSTLRAILNNDWVKLIAAFILGGAGGEAHNAVRGDKGPGDDHERRLVKLEQREKVARARADELEGQATRTRGQLYALGRYTYRVMEKQGVLVYVKDGVAPPAPMEFQPAPLKSSKAPPVQPDESFPVPDRP